MDNQTAEQVKKKKKGRKALIILGCIALVVAAAVVLWLAWLDAEPMCVHAMWVVDDPVSEESIDDFLKMEQEYAEASPLVRMFFSYKDEMAERRAAYNVLIGERADTVSAEIDALPAYTKIESKEQYEQIAASITAVQLDPEDGFEGEVRKVVDNYSKLEQYIQDIKTLRDTYKHTCEECDTKGYQTCTFCRGTGREKCTSCNGSGKQSQTWYSNGDWGDKSYTSSTCSSCKGSGSSDCYCDFGRTDCYCEEGYVYIYEDGK